MRIERAPTTRLALPLGVAIGLLALFGAGAGALWLRWGLPVPACAFRSWSGWPCPTCGSTRMLQALLRGDAVEALAWNPLTAIALVGCAVWAVLSAAAWLTGRAGWRVRLNRWERRVVMWMLLGLVLAGWSYLVWRGV